MRGCLLTYYPLSPLTWAEPGKKPYSRGTIPFRNLSWGSTKSKLKVSSPSSASSSTPSITMAPEYRKDKTNRGQYSHL